MNDTSLPKQTNSAEKKRSRVWLPIAGLAFGGAYEGGNSLIFTPLGYTAGAGVALALVRRGGILFWTLIGGIILLWRGAKQGADQLVEGETD